MKALLLVLFCVILPLEAQTLPAPPAEATVVFRGQTLFALKARLAAYTPQDRARAITERLERVASDPFQPLPPLQLAPQETSVDLLCGDTVLMTITEADAKAEGLTREALAQQRLEQIQPALQAQTWKTRLKHLALSVLWTLLVTAGGYLVFRGVRLGFQRLRARLDAIPEGKFPTLRLQQLELIPALRVRQASLRLLGLLKWALVLTLGYVYLSIIFSFFPATRGLAERLFRLVLGPLGTVGRAILDYLPNLFFLLLIALGTRYLLKLVHLIFKGIESGTLVLPSFHPEWAEPTYRLSRFFVFGFALVMAFPYLPGSGSEAFKGVSLFFGLVFSLGSSGAVSNAVAGILITYMRPFQVGDRIAVGETVGDVVEKSLLVTRVRTPKLVDVTIPNATLLGAQVQNFSANAKSRGLILHSTVTIGYDAPWRTVHSLLLAAAEATEGLLKDPKPFVLQTSLDDFYVSYQINGYTDRPSEQARIYSDLHANIQERFNEAGVEIMSPHYRAARDGSPTTLPAQYLPEGYEPPPFRIRKV